MTPELDTVAPYHEIIDPFERMTAELHPCLSEISDLLGRAGNRWPAWIIRGMEADLLRGYHLAGEIATLAVHLSNPPAVEAHVPVPYGDLVTHTRIDLSGQLAVFLASARRHIAHAKRLDRRISTLPQAGFWGGLALMMAALIVASLIGRVGN